ncbi:NAD(P)H-binding protein [Ideonella sp. 4Y11]|uniref:NAD(P)H-binding protein n=1 Tax=Ideonella aquatica TaxID=2824119 RepID=A0A940YL20_9BURK|nr:NAD-dependent epimerase/dehydratase family protein [Ideonella aquatica]MBQ0958972.1 NAD(P)H-binding protein [Ideonella aquatica]
MPRTLDHRPSLLIVGCGDVGMRVLRLLAGRWRVLALTSQAARTAELRSAGATPLIADLDQPASLWRLAGLADAVLHLAPPPGSGREDPRTRHLLQALARCGQRPRVLVYGSTTGVYGDAGGALFDETRPVAPSTERAWRRVDAERALRAAGRCGWRVALLRIPGIHAADRVGGSVLDRVRQGRPLLRPEDDVFTNHIHADDLARACVAALWRGGPQRAYHITDGVDCLMGEWYDQAADLAGLPRLPRVSRDDMARTASPMSLSFMGESRRLRNERMRAELGVEPRHQTPG